MIAAYWMQSRRGRLRAAAPCQGETGCKCTHFSPKPGICTPKNCARLHIRRARSLRYGHGHSHAPFRTAARVARKCSTSCTAVSSHRHPRSCAHCPSLRRREPPALSAVPARRRTSPSPPPSLSPAPHPHTSSPSPGYAAQGPALSIRGTPRVLCRQAEGPVCGVSLSLRGFGGEAWQVSRLGNRL